MSTILRITATPYNYDLQDTANESITVGELIERLQDFSPSAKVVFRRNSESICEYLWHDSFKEY